MSEDVTPGTAIEVAPNGQPLDVAPMADAAASVQYAVAIADQLVVNDEESKNIAIDLMNQVKDAIKTLEASRLALVKPIKDVTSKIDASAREMRRPLEAAEATMRARVNAYLTRQLEERRAAEKAREEADTEAGAISDPAAVDRVAQHVDRRVQTSGGTAATVRERWVGEGVDIVEFVKFLAAAPSTRKKKGWPAPTAKDWAMVEFNGHAIRNEVAEGRREFPPGIECRQDASVAVGR